MCVPVPLTPYKHTCVEGANFRTVGYTEVIWPSHSEISTGKHLVRKSSTDEMRVTRDLSPTSAMPPQTSPKRTFRGVSWLHHNEDGVSQVWASRTDKVINTEGSAPSRAHSRINPQTHNLG